MMGYLSCKSTFLGCNASAHRRRNRKPLEIRIHDLGSLRLGVRNNGGSVLCLCNAAISVGCLRENAAA